MVELTKSEYSETDIETDNALVAQLMTSYDGYGLEKLKLLEHRRFLSYFYLGNHEIKIISGPVAIKYKDELGAQYYPANFLPEFVEFSNLRATRLSSRFLIRKTDSDGTILKNTWEVVYLSEFDQKLSDLLDKLKGGETGKQNYVTLLNNIDTYNHAKDLMYLAGLFASGKFIQYYNDYIKSHVTEESSGQYSFDPLTGTVTNIMTKKEYKFSDLRKAQKGISDDETYRYKLYNNIPEKYTLFCTFCEYVSKGFNSFYLNPANSNGFTITSFWDFTPIESRSSVKSRPYEPGVTAEDNFPAFIVDPTFREYLRNIITAFMAQTPAIDSPKFSYKDVWNGSVFKASNGKETPMPFYYCLPLNEDKTDEINNPLANDPTFKELTAKVEEIKEKQREIMLRLENLAKNITNMKSCVNTNTTIINAFIKDGGSIDATQENTCSFNENLTEDTDVDSKLEANGDFTVDGEIIDKVDIDAKQEAEEKKNNNGTTFKLSKEAWIGIIVGVVTFVILLLFIVGLMIYANNKKMKNMMKNIASSAASESSQTK